MSVANVNFRYIPDNTRGGGTPVINGRQVVVSANSYVDCPIEQATQLGGWICVAQVGTTAQRPMGTSIGTFYIDTTLTAVVVSDGKGAWHNALTGAVV